MRTDVEARQQDGSSLATAIGGLDLAERLERRLGAARLDGTRADTRTEAHGPDTISSLSVLLLALRQRSLSSLGRLGISPFTLGTPVGVFGLHLVLRDKLDDSSLVLADVRMSSTERFEFLPARIARSLLTKRSLSLEHRLRNTSVDDLLQTLLRVRIHVVRDLHGLPKLSLLCSEPGRTLVRKLGTLATDGLRLLTVVVPKVRDELPGLLRQRIDDGLLVQTLVRAALSLGKDGIEDAVQVYRPVT